jgi:hypothetical protein
VEYSRIAFHFKSGVESVRMHIPGSGMISFKTCFRYLDVLQKTETSILIALL